MSKKIFLILFFSWITGIGYLTWFNGLSSPGRYSGFNWEEWIWFGLIPGLLPFLLYFILNPESLKRNIQSFKELFK